MPKCLSLVALLLRIAVLFYGEIQDQTPGLHYTDIDYLVFSDASDFLRNGSSPYNRPTYRYSPLLAAFLLPNGVFGRKFGKILFCLFDVLTGALIQSMVPSEQSTFCRLLWDFNPFVINISTRGNSDSITAFLLVFVLFLLERRYLFWAAFFFGLSVHLRIFPAFLCLTLLCYLRVRIIPFGIIAYCVFGSLNLLFFWLYDAQFVGEAYLYHFVRRDSRHNFAAPWLSIYFGEDPTISWAVVRILLCCAISLYSMKDLRRAWAAIVVCFIAYNTVCTVQYFDWAIALLALIPRHIRNKRFLACAVAWLVPHLIWLGTAYRLEFRAEDVFFPLWIASLAVFVGNNAILYGILRETHVKRE
jgi:phosphatidylinositol glycan class M